MFTYIFLFLAVVPCSVVAEVRLYEYTCFSYKVIDEHETISEIRCNSTEVFSPDQQKCIVPGKSQWPCGQEISCEKKDNKKYVDVKEGCKTYYTCHLGVFFGHNYCPGNTVFNEAAQYCDWQYNVAPPCGPGNSIMG